jgi:hypothetical protein
VRFARGMFLMESQYLDMVDVVDAVDMTEG